MECNINITETTAFKELADRYGSNKTAVMNRVLAVQNPAPKIGKPFDEWYKDKFGEDADLNGTESKVMADRIEEFYYYSKASVARSAIDNMSVDEANLKGYSDTDARNEGIQRACEFIFISQSQDRIDDKIEYNGNGNRYVKDNLRRTISDEIVNRICDRRGLDKSNDDVYNDVYNEFDDAKAEGLDNLIDFVNNEFANGTVQDKNLAALCFEIMNDKTIDSFIGEMVRSNANIAKTISSVKEIKSGSEEKENNIEATQENTDDADEQQDEMASEPGEDSRDVSIGNANNHLGSLPDFKMHVDDTIRTFLSAIYKLNSATSNNYDYNTDNKLGLPSLMDANQLMNILYSCVDYTNGQTMLESIKMVAEQVPGMQGLIQVYDKLNEDKDLRYNFYRTFGKSIVSKLETVLNGSEISTRISNRNADRLTSLYFEYFNSSKRTSINLSKEVGDDLNYSIKNDADALQNALKYKASTGNTDQDGFINEVRANIVDNLTRALKRHCPSIDVATVSNYLVNHPVEGREQFTANIDNILAIVSSLNSAAVASKASYDAKINEVIIARAENKKIKESGYANAKQLYDETSAFRTEYATSMQAPTMELAKMFVNYTVVKTELNSRNVHGNLSSDVINSSMITNIMKTLQNEVALKNFGDYKSLSNQYNLSNILVEKRDKNGTVINLGLFKVTNGKFTPTSYAQDLLKVRLFNGAGDENNGHNVLYSEMSKGDYIATSLVNFFDANSNTNGNVEIEGITLGSYFMKIPSDAPKNFCITAPRYSTGTTDAGLFRFADPQARAKIDAYVKEVLSKKVENQRLNGDQYYKEQLEKNKAGAAAMALIGNVDTDFMEMLAKGNLDKSISTKELLNKALINEKIIESNRTPIKTVEELADAIVNLTGKDSDIVSIRKNQFKKYPMMKYKEGASQLQQIAYKVITEDGEETYYFIEGKLVERNGVEQLENAKFAGFLKYNINPEFNKINSEISEAISTKINEEWIKNGTMKRVVNTDHPIFKQLRYAFVQELTDAATALEKIFVTEPVQANKDGGCVNFKEVNGVNVPDFKEGFDNSKESARKLYKLYHVGKEGTILTKKDGRYELTGNVFKSDRFVYTDRVTGESRNFGNEILSEAFNLLYGGVQRNYIHTRMVNGRLIAVPTPQQMEVINAKLSEFLELTIADSITRVDNIVAKYNNLPSHYTTVDSITEYAANYLAMYISFNDLFEGDSKFYKGTQDILKRAKEVQGSGVPYGTFDITRPLVSPENATSQYGELGDPLVDSMLNDMEFTPYDKDGNAGAPIKISHYPRFVGATITNTAITGKTIGEFVKVGKNYKFKDKNSMGVLSKKLMSVFMKQGYTAEDAYNKTEEMMSGYCGTKANDAQSYITFEEWIRRITARGQLNKYLPLINKILDESQEITPTDLTQFVQVQKNFYYDQHYNKELGVIAPRQIKNAEFVLVPRFIKGTELEEVYNIMKRNGIDQLNTEETSKAGKCKVLSLWNNDGVLDADNVKDFEKNINEPGFKEYFDYNYLYTQSETPQHMDTTNKAGIQIMKKIVDNIPPEFDSNGKPKGLYKKKLEFFDVYSENIHDNFEELMDEFGIETDAQGNIKLQNGEIPDIDYDVFFKRLDDEFRRQGLDSNLRAYITQKAKGSKETDMPLDMGSFSGKLESIAQSLFNSRITRQTLPGYHAAQITNIGWNKFSDVVEGRTYSKELRYHPDGKDFVEIMLPKSIFKFSDEMLALTDEELIDILNKEGLDMSIGYRIPTEGKQSVCKFKLVGFTDASLGSTIVVPNDWVAQTGSDFDIDSVYGITPEYFHDGNGMIHKVQYKEVPDLYDWYRYINRNANKKQNFKLKETIKGFNSEIQNELNAEMDKYQEEEHKYYQELHSDLKEEIKTALAEIKSRKTESNKQDNYLEMLAEEYQITQDWLDKYGDDISDEEYNNAALFADACRKIAFHIENAKDAFDNAKREKVNALVQQTKDNFEAAAKDNGLLSYDEFIKNPVRGNTRKQRNNKILDTMMEILSDEQSLEENLSRSNFDAISEGKAFCYSGTVEEKIRNNRSAYNILDQADFQEDAMSGAKLKAFSVTRDTFVSVCNTVRPYISDYHTIKIGYEYDDVLYKKLQEAYNDDPTDKHVTKSGDKMFVVHNRLGWSNTNHNVVDRILTAYDSQTTAYILDAIKEGAIPNVNDATFGVYKTFTDIGSSHLVSIAFMMQPGIKRIVDNYNANKSIYQSGNNNSIHAAIKDIARELGVTINGELVSSKSKIDEVIKAINANEALISRFRTLFNNGREYSINLGNIIGMSDMTIDVTKLLDRIKNKDNSTTPVERIDALLHDLFIVLQYNKISKLSDRITLHSRVSNPDRFGAKQTIYATRKIFKDINRIIDLEETDPTLIVDNGNGGYTSFIQSIYPGVENGIEDYMTTDYGPSAYPPLNAFLKYATCTSIKINKGLFLTQDDNFIKNIERVEEAFTHNDNSGTLSEKVYNEYKNYTLGKIYSQIPVIQYPIGFNIENEESNGFSNRRYTYGVRADVNPEDERRRIFGYGYSIKTDLHVNDLNNPTKEEIEEFSAYTPAQKVAWIVENFSEPGIFGYIDVNMTNNRNIQLQRLSFREDLISPEATYTLFKQAFYNNTPFVKLAAYDLIKYGFMVEGFKMSRNGIAKTIVNDILVNDETAGITAIDSVKNSIKYINDIETGIEFDSNLVNYVRSHSGINQIATRLIDPKDKAFFANRQDGMIILSKENSTNTDGNDILDMYNISYTDDSGERKYNKFVKLKDRRSSEYTLYEIREGGFVGEVCLIPLNKLEASENSTFSVNPDNNKFQDRPYYINMIASVNDMKFEPGKSREIKDIIDEYSKQYKKQFSYEKPPVVTDRTAKEFNLEEDAYDAYRQIVKNIESNGEPTFYFISNPLTNYIKTPGTHDSKTGEIFCSIQDITANGVTKKYKIVKINPREYWGMIVGSKDVGTPSQSLNNVLNVCKQSRGLVNSIFYAEEFNPVATKDLKPDTRNSTASEKMITLGIRGMIGKTDDNAAKALARLENKNITVGQNKNNVAANLSDAIEINTEYVVNAVDKIMSDCNYFCKDDEGNYYSIADDYSINQIKSDVDARNRYIKICNDARGLVKNFQIIKELDIDAEDNNDKRNLRKIREKITEVDNNVLIKKAEERFVNDYLAKLSGNPLVKSDIITLLDGYHSTSFFDCYIGDLQETSNPLIQIVTKEAMADIRGKEMLAKKRREEFVKAVNKIIAKARAAGRPVDMSKIIDNSGRFIQEYSNALVDDMTEYRNKMNEAKEKYGVGSNQYQLAKMAYDQWKLDYIHQPAPDTYYANKLENVRRCLIDYNDPSKGFEPVYLKYCNLADKRREILSHTTADGILDEEYKNQLKDINRQISNLTSHSVVNEEGEFVTRYEVNNPANPFATEFEKQAYRPGADVILKNFLTNNKLNKEKYFKTNAKFGFEEELAKNIDILNSYPKDANGNYVTPINLLMEDEKFAKAKEWLDTNATVLIPEKVRKEVDKAYQDLKTSKVPSKLSRIAKEREAYDTNGVIDATKLTEEDIKAIYDEQAGRFNYEFSNAYSDSNLMSAVNKPLVVYTSAFYGGLLRDINKNPEWLECINKINDILKTVYSASTGRIATSELSEAYLDKLNSLYNELSDLRKYSSTEGGKRVFDFMSENVEAVYDEDTFNFEMECAKARFGENTLEYRAWYNANTELQRDASGELVLDADGRPVIKPNHFLYGYIKPIDTEKFVDKKKTSALQTLAEKTENILTPYYYQKLAEMRKLSPAEYNDWYEKNHIYNPNKHITEPLPCWYQVRYKLDHASSELKAEDFAPKWAQSEEELKDEYKYKDKNGNYYYTAGYGNAYNYKRQPTDDDYLDVPEEARDPGVDYHKYSRKDSRYDNSIKLNEYERELKTYLEDTLLKLANTSKAKKYFEKGYVPMRAKAPARNAKYWQNQALQMVGWTNSHSGNEVWYEDESIDYSRDREITIPMLNRLGQRTLLRVPEGATEEEKAQIAKENEEITKENNRIINEVIDNNWIGAIEEFILQAGHYNAVQDNKQLLFFAKNMLERMDIFDKKVGQSDLHKNYADSTDDTPVYVMQKDKRLQEQYTNWLRRLLYDQYKEPNDWLTRSANIMQSLTSSKFMMLNITGGISNVTLGFNQIIGEAFAKEYFGTSEWFKAHNVYSAGFMDYMSNAYSEKSNTLAGAMIKFFDVVDFNEIRGVVPDTLDFGNFLDRTRAIMFSPQTAGEHYMQNTVMFAMMDSHRVIENNDVNINRETIAGLPQHKIMNESEYVAQALENKVKEIIGADRFEQFLEFKKSITKDPNVTKEYAWFKKDPITDFVQTHLTKEEKQKYIADRDAIKERCKKEFEKAPKLKDQFKLDTNTGTLTFADDSLMSQMQEDLAFKMLGEFKDRVVSVNKKIHGVYDKLGAAKIESTWWGSLVMQYHKHLYPGIMKRYRRQGYYNEERGTVEKGMFWSFIDFVSIPFDNTNAEFNALPENEQNALKSVQIFMKQCADFMTNVSLNWHILPDYERANIKRNLGDMLGWASAILCAIALRSLGDDDDDDKFYNIMYNLSLYEADRLASESFMYNPIGLISEAKTLWSSPLACQNGITDLATALGEIGQYLIQGDDYDGRYKTGIYAGENRLRVRLTRQLPIYRAIERLWNLDKSNNYYKIGTTGTGIVPIKKISDAIKDATR